MIRTVKELIKTLQQFDPKCDVLIDDNENIQYILKCSEQVYKGVEGEAERFEYIKIVSN